MERRVIFSVICLLMLAPTTSFADRVYVTDRFQVPMRASQNSDAPVVETLVSGTALDTLEQIGNEVHVRAADGSNGWVDSTAITHDLPARMQLDALQAQQTSLQAKLAKAQAALAQETAHATDLENKLRSLATAPTPPAATPTPPPAPAPAPAAPAAQPAETGQSPYVVAAWLGLSFAMLIIGFFAGMIWLRETNRRKLGGMYLRI